MKPVTAALAMVTATPNPPITVTSQRATYCVMCSALGRPCPFFSLPAPTVSAPHSNWSDIEEEEDWDGERQRENECREKEQKEKELKLKSKSNTVEEYYLPSPEFWPYSPVNEIQDTLVPTLTDTLVPTQEKKPEKGEQKMEADTQDKSDMDSETDSDLDNTVDILRTELI